MGNSGKHTQVELSEGKILSVRGSVVDIWFDKKLPSIYTLLRAGVKSEIPMEVLSQLDINRVRGIALTPTQGLSRGMPVENTGKQLQVPVGNRNIGKDVQCLRKVPKLFTDPFFRRKNAQYSPVCSPAQ